MLKVQVKCLYHTHGQFNVAHTCNITGGLKALGKIHSKHLIRESDLDQQTS